jgi:hypothetical protein
MSEVRNTVEPIPVILEEKDIDPAIRTAIIAAQRGTRMLGSPGASSETVLDPERLLLNALPSVIARKIEGILPSGFKIAELEFCFKVEGKLWGSGVAGEVKAVLRPID